MGSFDGADCNVIESKLIFLTLHYTVLTEHNSVAGVKEIKAAGN